MDLGTWKPPRLHAKGRWHGLRHPGTEERPSLSLAGQRGDWRLERRDLQGAGWGLINWDGSRVHGSVCLGLAGVRTRAGTLRRGMVPIRRGCRTKVSEIPSLPQVRSGVRPWKAAGYHPPPPTRPPASSGTSRDPAAEVAPAPFPAPSCPRQWGRKQVLGA